MSEFTNSIASELGEFHFGFPADHKSVNTKHIRIICFSVVNLNSYMLISKFKCDSCLFKTENNLLARCFGFYIGIS